MRIPVITTILLLSAGSLFAQAHGSKSAQQIDQIINPAAVEKIEKTLSSDDMQGRATFTPGIEKAAEFIESQFRQAGLKTLNGAGSYRQPFTMLATTPVSATATIDGQQLGADRIVVVSAATHIQADDHSGFEKAFIKAGASFGPEVLKYMKAKKNTLVLVDSSFAKTFPRLARFTRQQFKSDNTVIFLLTSTDPTSYSITAEQQVTEKDLANIVGVLPGKSKKEEYVIFSGHYDHLGIGKPDAKGDSIYNGANDDASGTTAVIMLANYFAKKKNNQRTLVFATFTAEEIGEFGSEYFSNQFDPEKVMAMFNIEMIGTESKWGTNSAYITGFERTDMGKILEKNLAGSGFTFYPDPYPQENLFYRSDNATLAKQGVPAHTISTSKMDSEKYYHTAGDEIGTLDMKNMAAIIRSIAISSKSIVDGKDTPTRVDTKELR